MSIVYILSRLPMMTNVRRADNVFVLPSAFPFLLHLPSRNRNKHNGGPTTERPCKHMQIHNTDEHTTHTLNKHAPARKNLHEHTRTHIGKQLTPARKKVYERTTAIETQHPYEE